jgi:hypothetical protein
MRADMKRLPPVGLLGAKLGLVLLLAGNGGLTAPAWATSRDGYSAALASPLAQPRQQILDGVLWKCAGERCAANGEGSRPVLVCERVARAFGHVARFATPNGELSNEDLSRCNGEN